METQLRFTFKVVVNARFSRRKIVDGVEQDEIVEIKVALPPMPCMPLARPDERFRRFISEAQTRYERQVEEVDRNTSSGWTFVGMLWINLLSSPGELTGDIPLPAGVAAGGCWKDLPAHLRAGRQGLFNPRNMDHRCFEFCVTACFHEVGKMDNVARKTAARTVGAPFYDEPSPPGRKSSTSVPRKMVVVEADFSTLRTQRNQRKDKASPSCYGGDLAVILRPMARDSPSPMNIVSSRQTSRAS